MHQGTQRVYGNSEGTSGEAVHVSGVDADDFALGVEDGAAAAAVGGGGIVDKLVADHVAVMAAGGGGTNQRQGGQSAGRVNVVEACSPELVPILEAYGVVRAFGPFLSRADLR